MIARLKGLLEEIGPDWAVLDVGGVGYLVYCPARTIAALPPLGAPAMLHIETHVREDHIHLYGFATPRERETYRLLTTVQGVGSRVALAILGVLTPDELIDAVMAQDKAQLTRADGVGPRLATRLLTELGDRVLTLTDGLPGAMAAGIAVAPSVNAASSAGMDQVTADTISALVNLGYGRAEAFGAVSRAARADNQATVEALIPAALKELGQ